MKTWYSAVSAVVLLLALTSATFAHDEFRFIGTVTKIDTARGRVTMKVVENKKEETIEIALTPKTEITRDKKRVARSELKAGLYLVVDALGDDYDSLEAIEIRIVPPPK
jgi:hypothetical protein